MIIGSESEFWLCCLEADSQGNLPLAACQRPRDRSEVKFLVLLSASERLSAQHHRIGTVPDGVLQIANFRPSRDRALDPL